MEIHEFIEENVYFNVGINQEYMKKTLSLIINVCERLKAKDEQITERIFFDIEFIIIKPIEDFGSPNGGLTTQTYFKCKPSRRMFVIFNPNFIYNDNVTLYFALAHEFAHVYLGHPLIVDNIEGKELSDLKNEHEYEASKLAYEWGFIPSDEYKKKDLFFRSLSNNSK